MKVEIAAERCFWIYDRTIKVNSLPPVGSKIELDGEAMFIVKWHYYRGHKDWRGRLICRLVGEFKFVEKEEQDK